jgi:Xaa-Pro aminopeptidase
MPRFSLPKQWFQKNKADAVFIQTSEILADPLFTKFTGISRTDFSFQFVQNPNKNLLLTSPLEAKAVKQNYQGKVQTAAKKEDFVRELKPFFQKKTVGIDEPYLTVTQLKKLKKLFPKTKWKNVSESLRKTRAQKNAFEKKMLKKANSITRSVLESIIYHLESGIEEIEVAAYIDYLFAGQNCRNSFPTIVAFGKHSGNIHHFNTKRKLKKKDIVLIDCGAKFEGYCADVSRTVCFGSPANKQKQWYEKCFEARQTAFKKIKPMVSAGQVSLDVESVLGETMPHALGHGIGLEAHDVPQAIFPKAKWKFEKEMVLAVEPGHYEKNFGIRIEDNVLVTKNGIQKWGKTPKILENVA